MQDQLDKLWEPFLTWQFAVSCVFVVAVMRALKKFTRAAIPGFYVKGWFKGFMTSQNIFWGLVIATIPDFLPGRFGARALLGICAGFMSHFVYELFLKRLGFGKADDPETDDLPAPVSPPPAEEKRASDTSETPTKP